MSWSSTAGRAGPWARPPLALAVAAVVATLGCGSGPATCDTVVEPAPRMECRLAALEALVDRPDDLALALARIEDPAEHDLVALRLMVQAPSLFPLLCPQMRTPSARDRCSRLETRPHLSERARRPEAPTP